MSVENIVRNYTVGLSTLGRTGLNIKYPDEIELYMLALELIDSNSQTEQYFIFPVMPSSLVENKPQMTNVKKTFGGVSVLSHPGFVPTDINITGTFGRKFRLLSGDVFINMTNGFSTGKSRKRWGKVKFSDVAATGYGCCKIVEQMVEDSRQLDDYGNLRTLVLHNPALGNSYLVKPVNLNFSQDQSSNMIWNYTLQLKSIAPLDAMFTAKQQARNRVMLNTGGLIQKQVNFLLNKATNLLAQETNI